MSPDIDYWVQQVVTTWDAPDTQPIDETSLALDPTDELPDVQQLRTARYSARAWDQVRTLGGIEAEAALITHQAASFDDTAVDTE